MVISSDKLTLLEVARELGRSLEQVRRYVREGKLAAEKLGMQWFVERQALEAFKGPTPERSGDDILPRARALRKRIEERVGPLNLAALLDESRREHP